MHDFVPFRYVLKQAQDNRCCCTLSFYYAFDYTQWLKMSKKVSLPKLFNFRVCNNFASLVVNLKFHAKNEILLYYLYFSRKLNSLCVSQAQMVGNSTSLQFTPTWEALPLNATFPNFSILETLKKALVVISSHKIKHF